MKGDSKRFFASQGRRDKKDEEQSILVWIKGAGIVEELLVMLISSIVSLLCWYPITSRAQYQ